MTLDHLREIALIQISQAQRTNAMTLQEAQRKARYGHRDYIAFTARNGVEVVDRLTPALLKQAMLAGGTKGKFYVIAANSGVMHRYGWRVGLNMLRNWQYIVA